ncbi:hypothetical protein JXQ31_17410 [candidate division KSB1 bacterium]|nr:hypothetical protein [candidate division KSB1 bacterium]
MARSIRQEQIPVTINPVNTKKESTEYMIQLVTGSTVQFVTCRNGMDARLSE